MTSEDKYEKHERMMNNLRNRALPYMNDMIRAVLDSKTKMDKIHQRPMKMNCDDAHKFTQSQHERLDKLIQQFEEENFITDDIPGNLVQYVLWSHRQFADSLRAYAWQHNSDLVAELEPFLDLACMKELRKTRYLTVTSPIMATTPMLRDHNMRDRRDRDTSTARIERTQLEAELKRWVSYREKITERIDELLGELDRFA